MEKNITYFRQPARVACDEKCNKAWGANNRPRVYSKLGEKIFGLNDTSIYPDEDDIDLEDIDDYAYCSDDELCDAPSDPGTYEGECAKPICDEEKMNKWCVRECERCQMTECGKPDETIKLKDFSKRVYNYNYKNK